MHLPAIMIAIDPIEDAADDLIIQGSGRSVGAVPLNHDAGLLKWARRLRRTLAVRDCTGRGQLLSVTH